jgi:proteasome lid subunit RPN8/RPN11
MSSGGINMRAIKEPVETLIISNEVKKFIRKNKETKDKILGVIIGEDRGRVLYAEKILSVEPTTTCPQDSKWIKTMQGDGNKVIGLIHSHPGQEVIPSTVDLQKGPLNKAMIIIGSGMSAAYYKGYGHIIELKIKGEVKQQKIATVEEKPVAEIKK